MTGIAHPVLGPYRLTIPAREALEREGNNVGPLTEETSYRVHAESGHPLYEITLRRPPSGLVLCLIGHGDEQHRGLRLADEPEYPGEWDGGGIAWHERGELVPCPTCGASLVWYEAGYVPGYRICTGKRQHHVQLASDGRSAKAVPGRRGVSL